jgi:peptidylprolyl isomerase
VSVSGVLGSPPIVDFPTPFVGRDASIATVIPGSGDVIESGSYVDFEATVYGGADQAVLTATTYGANGAPSQRIPIEAGSSPISDAFLCQQAGARFTLTGTSGEIFGATSGNGPTDDTVVVVFDVINAYPRSSSGLPQFAQDGMPAVTSAPDGRPGIAVPSIAPPTELRISTLTKGNGPAVSEGQTVVVHYTGVLWGGGVFDSTWEMNRPADLVAQSYIDNAGVGVVPGFAKALIGQTVGSRVLVAIPPSEGYPAGQEPAGIPANATMIFVIDILGTK